MSSSDRPISHWHNLADAFQTSALDFYKSVEAELELRDVPNFRTERVAHQEGGVLSAKREYLRVIRDRLTFDLCAAPYGKSFFFSWWLAQRRSPYAVMLALVEILLFIAWFAFTFAKFGTVLGFGVFTVGAALGLFGVRSAANSGMIGFEDGILAMPGIGMLYSRFFRPETYYVLDTTIMFQESVRRAVNSVIADLRSQQGLRALTEAEQQPHMRSLVR